MVDRRRFLRTVALSAAGAPLLGARQLAASTGPALDVVFTHGVASGDPGSDRVVIWTRAESDVPWPVDVRWRVAADPRLDDVVVAGLAAARPERDGTVEVEVNGLQPGTTYWYGFSSGDRESPTGRTRTLPAADADRVRLAVLSCGNLETGWFNAYGRVAERDDVDLVVHLGDYLYEYGGDPDAASPLPGRAHRPRIELRRLAEYRKRYAQYRADPDLQHLHGRHPVVALWDDHEVADDSWATGAQAHGPEDGDFATRQTAALTAWREWHPRRPGSEGCWRSFRLGDLIDALLVDGRSHRPHRGDAQRPGALSDGLGGEQQRWVRGRLAESDARWPVVFTQQPVIPRFDSNGAPLGVAGWSGFPAAQTGLLDATRRAGALIVSGDVHSSWLLENGGTVEAIVPSVSSRSYADRKGNPVARELDLLAVNPALRWLDLRNHGYLIVDADRRRCRFEWWFVDTVDDRSAGQHLGHVHEIPAGAVDART